MSKSLTFGYFGDGKCDHCDKDNDDLLSISFDNEKETTTYAFCQECLENAVGDVANNDVEIQMLSIRAANE